VASSESAAGIDVRQYLGVLRRHVLVIAILTVALGVAGYAYASSQTPMYEATAVLLYEPQLDITDPTSVSSYGNSLDQELQLQSAVTIIGGPEMSKRVRLGLPKSAEATPYSVTAAIASSDAASGSGIGNTVTVSVSSSDPEVAAAVANLYAEQYVQYRIEKDQARIATAQEVINQKLKEFQTEAQQASSDFIILSERLRDLEILSATATGNFDVVIPATPPSTPYAPQPTRSAVMAGFLGFLLGVGYAILREKLDTRLRSYREVGEIMRLPVVGRIPVIPAQSLQKGPLVVVTEAEGRAAESLRALRGNIEFVSLGSENRVLMIVSAQKGEGKSLVVANLATSLALSGKKVALVDADLRRPRAHVLFGTPNAKGVSSVIAGICKLEDALQVISPAGTVRVRPGGNGNRPRAGTDNYGDESLLWLLTSGPIPPNPGEMVASQRFQDLIKALSDMSFDYVLIDSPAFMSVGDTTALAQVVDGILLLVNMSKTRRPILEEARDALDILPAPRLGVVTVADRTVGDDRYHYYSRQE
jgi:Mrp family chromosome partitioning ATPase/capsular polysaccharide biosynthesis protein